MKEITILSGKGGTGKTSITAAFASVAENTVFCDNDVDAADLHLIFKPQIKKQEKFSSGWIAKIDPEKCNVCNICINTCRFEAIHYNGGKYPAVNPFQCEGCRLCERVCPENAIESTLSENNFWFVSSSRFGILVHAEMGPGEENSGKLVTQIRTQAKELAIQNKAQFILNDGPPGIGCTTIASLTGTSSVLIIAEPTKSGLHDVKRLVGLIKKFQIDSTYAVINKFDMNFEIALALEDYFTSDSIEVLAKLPFDDELVEAMNHAKTIVEYNPGSPISKEIKKVWEHLKEE